MPPASAIALAVCGAALLALTARDVRAHGPSPRRHRLLTVLAAGLCATGLALLAFGVETAGAGCFALGGEAFFCSIVFVGPARDDDDDGHRGGGGAADPDGPAGPGGDEAWERFLAEHEELTGLAGSEPAATPVG